MIDPNEIERYGQTIQADLIAIGVVMLLMIVAVAATLWEPDVEAIGTWVHGLIF